MGLLRRADQLVRRPAAEVLLLALVAYVPALLSSPGRVLADSKQALFVDPGRFLAGAGYLWDTGAGAGTVPHQHVGYLWPMGPWFWLFDQIGVPDWVAQRLWWGTLVFLAALGARWLLRNLGVTGAAVLAGAFVYALTPYQLAFTARASVLLLPWVGLPWIVELTRRALNTGGWRHPALIALVVFTSAGVNASSLLLVALGPVLVLGARMLQGPASRRRALAVAARTGVLSLGVCAWWLAGLAVQGAHGMPVLQLTENLAEVARFSSPDDVLRGLGNWFFYGQDRLGFSIDQAEPYLSDRRVVVSSLLVPSMALFAAVLLAGRRRVVAVVAVSVATVIAVGSWPYHDPSWFGRAFRHLAEETSIGLAFRNSHRIVPVLVLGMAILIALGVSAIRAPRVRAGVAGVVVMGALAGIAPVLTAGWGSERLDRPERLPEEWVSAAGLLDEHPPDNPTRVWEVPGQPFAAHRWGNTVEPVLPALMDRPHMVREVLPYGSVPTADLLDAAERRFQEGVAEPGSVGPVARLFSVGDLVVRSDLQFERFGGPEPNRVRSVVLAEVGVGLGEPVDVGAPTVPVPDRRLAPVDEASLHPPGLVDPEAALVGRPAPPISILPVEDPNPLLSAYSSAAPVVLIGDGDGVVDAAAAGLLDGRGLVLYADDLDDAALSRVLADEAHLIVTDTNRRRIQTWFYAIGDTRGPTERAGETLLEPTGYDARLDLFPERGDAARSVVRFHGADLSASITGGAARPEDRAIAAFDGDPMTSWRVGGADPTGQRLGVAFHRPLELDHLVLTQPQDGPRDRSLSEVVVHIDGEPLVVGLDERSLSPEGQRVDLPDAVEVVDGIEFEISGVTLPPFDPAMANAVGFSSIEIPGLSVGESVVVPSTLVERVGARSSDRAVDVVLSRWRRDPAERGRTDPEGHLDRTVAVVGAREFGLAGTARVSPRASDETIDLLLGDDPPIRARASSRLAGDLDARAAGAVDDDPATAWTAAFGAQEGQWLALDLTDGHQPEQLDLAFRNDEWHSLPTVVDVELDGEIVDRIVVDPATPPGAIGSTLDLEVDLDGREVREIRLVVRETLRRSSPAEDLAVAATLPVSITSVRVDGIAPPARLASEIDTGCRSDLLTVDGDPVPVAVSGAMDDPRGLTVTGCDSLGLGAGEHRLVATPGRISGIDLDRVVLTSDADGGAAAADVRGTSRADAPWEVADVEVGRVDRSATLSGDGSPFWFVLGESHSTGWVPSVVDADTGDPVAASGPYIANGFANGWLIDPHGSERLAIALTWEPQATVWIGFGISLFTLGLCGGLVLGTPGRRSTEDGLVAPALHALVPVSGQWAREWGGAADTVRVVVVTLVFGLVTSPPAGVVVGVTAVGLAILPGLRLPAALLAPGFLVLAHGLDRPSLGWLALAVVVGAVLADSVTPPARVTGGRSGGPRGRAG